MATGIVSLAAYQIGLGAVAWALFAIAGVAYLVLWWLTILRIIRHPHAVFADLIDHLRGPGFFTMVSLIFYRYTFFHFEPGDLSPPYWINMGAMAISALAGSLLIVNAADAWFLNSIGPFIKGFTIFYWATGTWWIPMLVILGIWRHVYKRFPLAYDPLYWGAVFPIGMYAF